MKFSTKHNGQKVTVEYDEDGAREQEGSVLEFEITHCGHIVTKLLADHEETFGAMCEAHFKAHCEAEKFSAELYRGQELYEERMAA